MKVISSIEEIKKIKRYNISIGFVPTMGYLHEGHISLIKKAREENDIVITSIFVNPTQFGPNEDFEKYPRDESRDLQKCEENGCDIVFLPQVDEMYPDSFLTFVQVEELGKGLCGKSRPTHFRGVTTVLTKLFNIVKPDRAYFGQKDAQQLVIVKKMVEDLNMDVEIIGCPIVREADGLAISSRNTYLSPEERNDALFLNKSLKLAKNLIENGEKNISIIKNEMKETILSGNNNSIDYIEFVDTKTLNPVSEIKDKVLIAIAVKVGKTRLIDNIVVEL
ncbi:pantoate--beta-alanine ligase [Sporanaerobacter acetigenes]|uniref:Pantothenate synthetase n=1 Tax=Sporanaerobacter acetigenes DSM 13106 TaxID=1123281 RepID=A0A1M5VR68_9FIRM|nr:pantoate--beta-alanine ligase [Sporanaerobacter acetigenes]SHH77474.1 pantoate--beta-alanine ligase [Sporanaerobacter acetigenes DSM 13106]